MIQEQLELITQVDALHQKKHSDWNSFDDPEQLVPHVVVVIGDDHEVRAALARGLVRGAHV